MPSLFRSRRLLTAFIATSLCASLASCGSDDAVSSAAEARTVLLDKAMQTILEQPLAYPMATPAQVSSIIVRLQPGEETGFHRHDAPMYVYVLSGAVTVNYGDGIIKKYEAGSSFLEAIGTYHNGRNEGNEIVEILTVSIGAEGVDNTVLRP